MPEIPELETPETGKPNPETPAPEKPNPETPEPEKPGIVTPPGRKPSLLRVDTAAYLNNQHAAVHMFGHSRTDRLGEPGFGSTSANIGGQWGKDDFRDVNGQLGLRYNF